MTLNEKAFNNIKIVSICMILSIKAQITLDVSLFNFQGVEIANLLGISKSGFVVIQSRNIILIVTWGKNKLWKLCLIVSNYSPAIIP